MSVYAKRVLLLLLLVTSINFKTTAQKNISSYSIDDVEFGNKDYIHICDRIRKVNHKNGATVLLMASYVNRNKIQIMVPDSVRLKLKKIDVVHAKGGLFCITGKLRKNNEQFYIDVTEPAQLEDVMQTDPPKLYNH